MTAILLVKATVLLLAMLGITRALAGSSAVTRHRLWSVAFCAMLALPILAATMPSLDVPVPAGWWQTVPVTAARDSREVADLSQGASLAAPIERGQIAKGVGGSSTLEASQRSPRIFVWPSAPVLLLVLWLAGAVCAAGALSLSLWRVRRLAGRAEDLDDENWRSAAGVIAVRLRLRGSARLVISESVATPMAGGFYRPTIFLPAAARSWSDERRDVVLAHEMAHLAWRDPLRHLVARLALAVYWFHPLAWLAARQAAVAREQACDETVLALGTRRSSYARVLLELAEAMRASPPLAALPMVQRSLLENRVMAILNSDRRPMGRQVIVWPAIAVVLLTVSLAAVRPGVPAPASASALPPQPPSVVNRAPAGPVIDGTPLSAPLSAPFSTLVATVRARAADVAQAIANPRDSACYSDGQASDSFSGTRSSTEIAGRTIIYEQVGARGYDRIIQKSFGTLQLCMVAEDAGDRDDAGGPREWIGRARRVVIEARQGTLVQRMELGRQAGGGTPVSWRVGGADRAMDDAALQWRDRMLAALETTWEIAVLRGQASSLQGEISALHGERSSLQGEISSLQGDVSAMQGTVSSIHGEESSLRGEISAIQGHLSSLQGAMSSERGAISSLSATRYGATDADRTRIASGIAQHDAEIARIERQIRDYDADARIAAVERRITALKADGRLAAVEQQIRTFDLQAKVAAVQRRIAALDVEGKVAAIQKRVGALDVDRRTRQLEQRREGELKQLEASVAAIK